MAIDEYFESYSRKGYKFSDEILTRYALSLSTKPFVILSGISGTGKTKIAQLFEPQLPNIVPQQQNQAVHGDGEIILKVQNGLMKGDRGNFQYNQLDHIFEQAEIEDLNARIEEIRENRPESDENISQPVVMTIELADGQSAEIGVYLQRARNPLVRIRAKSARGAAQEFDSSEFFQNNFEVGDILKLRRVGVHRFRVDSINDEQVVAANDENEAVRLSEINNKCFISVKSNWTDSSELFGYYNPITEKYTMTKLLKFILVAEENPEIPFFVILDEMNLSKVEHYFSDFLSCMESRTVNDDGSVKQEGIHLYSGNHFVSTDDDEYDEIRSSLELPLNLYVTGTVNVDDTTYMFSPKVLDRANVIEFNEVYLGGMPNGGNFKLTSFPDFTTFTKASVDQFDGLGDEAKRIIVGLLDVLKKSNLHFGYRTISEVSHFISNSKVNIADNEDIELQALDVQILQKVLPKLYGNFAKLNEPLKEIIYFLSGSDGGIENFNMNQIEALDLDALTFSRSLEKLIKMYKTLSTQGFASFIE
ncbi:hypothetical protein KOI40_05520 [Aestuariicella sp. G3-2]|uniref:McrB family protein n=1 Tax=Pseudomaricurvus albidus TaxID=2842452 RepID=UPI001C0AEBAC|nr:hypothetical protein [Aestuariicella albida]MBU3069271.1 hypothetical protein [Aestuariicella albida]